MEREIEMEKNWAVAVKHVNDEGEYGDTWHIHYGPYSQEDASRITSRLNEMISATYPWASFQASASTIELKAKTVEEIFEAIQVELKKPD